jgi:hypothetical protein
VRRAVQAAGELDEDEFRELVAFFSGNLGEVPWPQRLAWIAKDWSKVTTTIENLIRQADSYFELIERSVGGTSEGDGSGPLGQAHEAVVAALSELKESLSPRRPTVKA